MNIIDRIKDAWSKRPVARFIPCPIIYAVLNEESGFVELRIKCGVCGSVNELKVNNIGLACWLFDGVLIQYALPGLTPIERDLLMNGVCIKHG